MSPRMQFVGASNGYVIPLPQVAEDLRQLAVRFARLDVDPFRVPVPDTNDEVSFCRSGNGRARNEKSGS